MGYIGISQNWDVGKPYSWTYMDRTSGPSRSDMESTARPDGIHAIHSVKLRRRQRLTLLCNLQLQIQRKEDSQRINPEERKQAARRVLGGVLDELPDWEGGVR